MTLTTLKVDFAIPEIDNNLLNKVIFYGDFTLLLVP